MPYIFRVIKVGQKADAPHGARLNTTWKNDKRESLSMRMDFKPYLMGCGSFTTCGTWTGRHCGI